MLPVRVQNALKVVVAYLGLKLTWKLWLPVRIQNALKIVVTYLGLKLTWKLWLLIQVQKSLKIDLPVQVQKRLKNALC